MNRVIAMILSSVLLALAVAGYQDTEVAIEIKADTVIEALLISTTELWVEVLVHEETGRRLGLAVSRVRDLQRGGKPSSHHGAHAW